MAKKNPGDVLTCDWNPVIGCERYSPACRACWYLDGIFPWQRRLGNIPAEVGPNEHHLFPKRLTEDALRPKGGIVGVVQHGDLFWDRVPDAVIGRVLDIVETVAAGKRKKPTYLFWTKRAARMADVLTARYPGGLPPFLAAAVSAEDQASADERLPHLARIPGFRVLVLEPLLGPVELPPSPALDWVVVGSETGPGARPVDLDWVRRLRDQVAARNLPFFIKQLGTSHKEQLRELDGRTWDEFPKGFVK